MKTKPINETTGYKKLATSRDSRFRFRTLPTHTDCLAGAKIVKWRTFCGTLLIFLLGLCTFLPSVSADDQTLVDYQAFPPFISATVKPNILLILDNSGSMNEFAYKEVTGYRCAATEAPTGYDEGKKYYGLFDSDLCYKYDNSGHYFYPSGSVVDDPATPNIRERSAGFDADPRRFSGNWLNWSTMRRLDVAKKVLTGGRLASDPGDYVLLGTPTERDYRRIYNDYTVGTDPYGVVTKNVYYTPFRQGLYQYFFNNKRNDEFAVLFNFVSAAFDHPDDLGPAGCADTGAYTVLTNDPSYQNVGESGYAYDAYFLAVKAGTVGVDRAPEGIVQNMADQVRFGYMQFNYGQGPAEGVSGTASSWDIDGNGTIDLRWGYADGGRIRNYVGDRETFVSPQGETVLRLVKNINQQMIKGWTPLEEVLNEAVRYYRQDAPCYTPDYPDNPPANNVDFEVNDVWDPYYFNDFYGPGSGEWIPCAKSFIILLTDGEPNQNSGASKCGNYNADFDGDGGGFLEDIAYLMNTEDVRPDLAGTQNISLYTVWTFEEPSQAQTAVNYLKRASRAGAFTDMNGDGQPWCEENCGGWGTEFYPGSCGSRDAGDLCTAHTMCQEWDRNCDGSPDTYFEAQDGDQIGESLLLAITDILRRSASGTAVSILSTSAHGEGSLFQAYFKPIEVTSMGEESAETRWLGYLHGLWVDDHGNLREDNGDFRLLYEEDTIIQFYFDEENGTRVRRNYVSADKPYGDDSWDETNISMNDIRSMWEAGKKLALRDLHAHPRKVYTTLNGTSLIDFDPGQAASFQHYLRAASPAESEDIMYYILGDEDEIPPTMRPRQVYVDTNGDTVADEEALWRLGDIIYSTPAVVSRPMENYDDIYSDPTYGEYEYVYAHGTGASPSPRPTVVYVGANDGTLHAFNAGVYRPGSDRTSGETEHGRYTQDYPSYYTSALGYVPDRGEEIWAFVPRALLPHLRWLTDPNYTHVYYVDLKPKIADVRIFPDDSTHPNGWGTVLIGGLRLGGGLYEVDDFNQDGAPDDAKVFSSCYFALDITNPGAPELLWEFTDPDHLGFTSAYPAVARVGDRNDRGDWYVVFGSGPTDFDGTSDQQASIYVLDLLTGNLVRRFGQNPGGDGFPADPMVEDRGFMAGAASMDINLDYQTNAIYVGESYRIAGVDDWHGGMYRILLASPDTETYPAPNGWKASLLAYTKADQAIMSPPGIATDYQHTPWVYWGTGRFFTEDDKVALHTQSFYGVKDTSLAEGGAGLGLGPNELIDVTDAVVTYGEPSTVTGIPDVAAGSSWQDMLTEMRGTEADPTYGWVLDVVDIAGWGSGERVLEKPSLFGGLAMFTSFKPNEDICGFGGEGRLYALYYETGTPYSRDVFSVGDPPMGSVLERSVTLGQGRPSSLAIHVGQEKGGKAYVQQSTGTIEEMILKTPFGQKSGNVLWYEE
jgi:type IV pilus assembly protein PilY1